MGLALALTPSCSLVLGIPDRSEAADDATTDSGVETSVDAELDATDALDATDTLDATEDSDAPVESAVDSTSDSADANVPFCDTLSPKPTFCDDFEGTYATRWSAKHPSGTGILSFDTGDSVGPPKPGHSLLAATTADETSYLEWSTSKVPASFHLAFDFRAEVLPTSDVTYVARVRVGSSQYVAIYALPGNTSVQDFVYHPDGGAPADHKASSAIAVDTWTHVELDVSFGASPTTAKLRLDGTEVLSTDLASDFSAGAPNLELGVAFVNTAAPRRFRYDNVVLDVK